MSILPRDTKILWDVEVRSEAEAFEVALDLLCENSRVLDGVKLREQVLERQKVCPPVLGNGIALPHARSEAVSGIVFAVVKFREAVEIGGELVRLMLIYGVPPSGVHEHLAMMARLVRIFRDAGVVSEIFEASDSGEFERLMYGE